jgi:hypothetical protein
MSLGYPAFLSGKIGFKNATSTGTTTLDSANASANDYTATLQAATGTLALVSGNLGTPSAVVLTNATGTAASLTAGNVTTIPALSGAITNTGNATVLGSFTMAQLSTAVSDGDPAYVGAANTFTGTTNTFTLPTTTGSTTTSGIAVAGNSLTTGTGIYAASSTLTSGKLLDLQVSGTAAAAGHVGLNIGMTGANATNSITTTAATISNTHTGTGATNIALTLISSGAATSNKGLNFTGVGSVANPHISLSDGGATPSTEARIYQTTVYRMTVGFSNSDRFMFDNTHGCASLVDNAYPLGTATYRWNSLAVGTGAATLGGTLAVTGATTLTGNLTSNGALISTPQALSGAGAVNVTTLTTAVTTTAPAQAITLADGTNGQIKTIVHQALSGGGTWVLTPTTKTGYTTITSIAVGETCTLQFFTTIGWCILSLRGAIAA